MTYGSGSTGYTSAARIRAVIEEYYVIPQFSVTTGALLDADFSSRWSSRAITYRDISLPYIIGGGEDNSAAGWWAYLQRLHCSTLNTSTRSMSGNLGLPAEIWKNWTADLLALNALSTLEFPDGNTTDSDIGRRVARFYMSSVVEASRYWRGEYVELLSAWAAAGSSAVGSS